MVFSLFKKAFGILMKKPFRLWGISLLSGLLTFLGSVLFGIVPGLSLGISWLISTSMVMVFLHGLRGEQVRAVHLFDCCKDWNTVKRTLGGMGWMKLWIFLWALIPIVGPIFAIVRSYEYCLTPYILVQEPDIPITEAIKVSKQRTYGYKGKMFLADLLPGIFFGVAAGILALFGLIPYVGVLFYIVLALLTIAYMALMGLFNGLVDAAFYEEITHPTMDPRAPRQPQQPQYQQPQYQQPQYQQPQYQQPQYRPQPPQNPQNPQG